MGAEAPDIGVEWINGFDKGREHPESAGDAQSRFERGSLPHLEALEGAGADPGPLGHLHESEPLKYTPPAQRLPHVTERTTHGTRRRGRLLTGHPMRLSGVIFGLKCTEIGQI